MKTLYHVSKKYLGITPTLRPKVPESALVSREGNIPRVCFSDKLTYCVRSIIGNSSPEIVDLLEFSYTRNNVGLLEQIRIVENPYVYATTLSDKIYTPPKASDFRDNNELWSISRIKVTFIGRLCLKSFADGNIKITDEVSTLTFKEISDRVQEPIAIKQLLRKEKIGGNR